MMTTKQLSYLELRHIAGLKKSLQQIYKSPSMREKTFMLYGVPNVSSKDRQLIYDRIDAMTDDELEIDYESQQTASIADQVLHRALVRMDLH